MLAAPSPRAPAPTDGKTPLTHTQINLRSGTASGEVQRTVASDHQRSSWHQEKTSCSSTDSGRPHRCCHILNKVGNIDLTPTCKMGPGMSFDSHPNFPFLRRTQTHLIHGSLPQTALDRLSRFRGVRGHGSQTTQHRNNKWHAKHSDRI